MDSIKLNKRFNMLPAAIGAFGSIAGGLLAGQSGGNKETKLQKSKRKLFDQMLASLNGDGPYSDLFNFDEAMFKKSFTDPAINKFKNQISPQIQQQYIASGQQRGTGLEDTLTRAGVDMNSMLDQHLYQAQQDAINRKSGAINGMLNMGDGAQNTPTTGQNLMSSLSGYLASPSFAQNANDIFGKSSQNTQMMPRKGFES